VRNRGSKLGSASHRILGHMYNIGQDCYIYLRLFISPSETSQLTTANLQFVGDSSNTCIVDNLEIPSCAVRTNGIPVQITIHEYDNMLCMFTELYNENHGMPKLYFYDVNNLTIKFNEIELDISNTVLIDGPSANDNATFVNMVKNLDKMYAPGEIKCTYTITANIIGAEAIQYENTNNGTVIVQVQTQGRINRYYIDGTLDDTLIANNKTMENTIINTTDMPVKDVNDMPPVFLDGKNCTIDTMLTGKCVVDPIQISVNRSECEAACDNGAQLLILSVGESGNISVIDGDTGQSLK